MILAPFIRKLVADYHHRQAVAKLQRMVLANRDAPATVSFRKHREAALKATRQ